MGVDPRLLDQQGMVTLLRKEVEQDWLASIAVQLQEGDLPVGVSLVRG